HSDPKTDTGIAYFRPSRGDIALGRVNSGHFARQGHLKDRLGEGAGAASHIQPAAFRRHGKPVQELSRNETAPTSHIGFVGVSPRPDIHRLAWLRRHVTVSSASAPERIRLSHALDKDHPGTRAVALGPSDLSGAAAPCSGASGAVSLPSGRTAAAALGYP